MTDERRGILYGFPVRLIDDGGCEPTGPISGFFLDALCTMFGFNGAIMEYEGSYLSALWAWAFTDWENEDAP